MYINYKGEQHLLTSMDDIHRMFFLSGDYELAEALDECASDMRSEINLYREDALDYEFSCDQYHSAMTEVINICDEAIEKEKITKKELLEYIKTIKDVLEKEL